MLKSKEEIIEFLLNNRGVFGQKFKRRKESDTITKEENLNKWLLENNIIFNFELTLQNIVNYLYDWNNENLKCDLITCHNIKKFDNLPSLTSYTSHGYYKFCSKSCAYKNHAINQMGLNNTSHKMTKEQCKASYKKASNTMKKKIADGLWTPNVTNSWAGSKVILNINDRIIEYRSSWDAFFHLCNPHLEYEKTRIEYVYKNNHHNYITDFTDTKNKIIYEIKPDALLNISRNKAKFQYAIEWCKNNEYEYNIITNDWFKNNFTLNQYLLENQQDKELIFKRLKQFDNEDKIN